MSSSLPSRLKFRQVATRHSRRVLTIVHTVQTSSISRRVAKLTPFKKYSSVAAPFPRPQHYLEMARESSACS
eukprot:5072303-Pyramimonas_sp.AAC.1